MLEYVHVSCVSYGACGWSVTPAVDVSNGLCTHVEHKGIHEGHVVLVAWLTRYLRLKAHVEIIIRWNIALRLITPQDVAKRFCVM